MNEINKTNLHTMATSIAKQLDKKDSKGEDGKIEASIWNEFVADKGGKQIRRHITLENAIKSIVTYFKKNAEKTGYGIEQLKTKWSLAIAPTVFEKVVTPPVRQVAASELPPQQFKFPDHIPEVKPLEYTEESLEEMFVKPGKDILEHREAGKINGETIALLINNSSTYEAKVNPKDAAYVFSKLMEEIPDLEEKFNGQVPEIIENIYNGLIERADELEINLLEEIGLSSIAIESAEPSEQIKICKAISEAIKLHDESAINEMNIYNFFKNNTPIPELAGKTIEDKVSGMRYEYDEEGKLQCTYKGNKMILCPEFEVVEPDRTILLEFEDGNLQTSYLEMYTGEDGNRWWVWRNKAGKAHIVDIKDENDNILETWSNLPRIEVNGEDTGIVEQTCFSKNGPQKKHFDSAGNLKYYKTSELQNDIYVTTIRDNNGILLGVTEEDKSFSNPFCNGMSKIYRNADGEIIATKIVSDCQTVDFIYKDADGNEITKEQFEQLVDERMR